MGCSAALRRPDGFVDLFKLRTGVAWVLIFQLGWWQESPGDGDTMERPSLEINLHDTHEEGKLYVVDSLNNLNKLNVCPAESQHALDEEESTVGAGENTAGSNRNQCLFFVTFILTLIISLALVSFVIFLIIQTRNEMDQISSRLLLEKKNIEELKKMNNMILKHLNQSGFKENGKYLFTQSPDLHDYLFTHADLKVPGE
ncbi:leucine-rich single-pass membrane protein 1 isoform X2 [Patagioenas fasciata]|uniref:leucine-rich single-pass membrane protein 1 isoform X2 n=2 Tax=Patagioenas fasciata TaxID=372321 RepID=UPI003A9A26D7